jgi:hypothetical protein
MQEFDKAHTIQTSLRPRSGSAIRSFSTHLTRSSYHTNDRIWCNTENTEPVVSNGGRLNPIRIPSTSAEGQRQRMARLTH